MGGWEESVRGDSPERIGILLVRQGSRLHKEEMVEEREDKGVGGSKSISSSSSIDGGIQVAEGAGGFVTKRLWGFSDGVVELDEGGGRDASGRVRMMVCLLHCWCWASDGRTGQREGLGGTSALGRGLDPRNHARRSFRTR